MTTWKFQTPILMLLGNQLLLGRFDYFYITLLYHLSILYSYCIVLTCTQAIYSFLYIGDHSYELILL